MSWFFPNAMYADSQHDTNLDFICLHFALLIFSQVTVQWSRSATVHFRFHDCLYSHVLPWFSPVPAPLVEDATASIDLMKSRRKKRKKRAGRPKAPTTPDTNTAANWKTTMERTGLMRQHRSLRCVHAQLRTLIHLWQFVLHAKLTAAVVSRTQPRKHSQP